MERVRLYPTARQVARLTKMLDVTRQLYNAALEERIEAYRRRGVSETASMQYRELSELRAEDARVASVYRECSDAALPGSILRCGIFSAASTWREAGVSAVSFREPLGDGRIFARLARIALRRASIEGNRPRSWPYSLRKGGPVPAFGRAMISRRGGRWYGIFECERAVASLPKTGRVVGLDRGVVAVVATSDGELFTLPASVERHRARVRGAQKRVSRRRRGGGWRASARMILARAHERLASARRDFVHKVSRALVDRYDVIALEKLNVRAMTRSARGTVAKPGSKVRAKAGLNREILHAGWSILRQLICEKAASAFARLWKLTPRTRRASVRRAV